jgi:hypothetical protein
MDHPRRTRVRPAVAAAQRLAFSVPEHEFSNKAGGELMRAPRRTFARERVVLNRQLAYVLSSRMLRATAPHLGTQTLRRNFLAKSVA